jgi:hypothetical protein
MVGSPNPHKYAQWLDPGCMRDPMKNISTLLQFEKSAKKETH